MIAIALLAACATDPEQGPLEIHKVVLFDIPVTGSPQPLTAQGLCFEVALPEPYDCAVTQAEVGGPERVIPWCDSQPDARPCWVIERDPMNCVAGEHQTMLIHRDQPAPYDYHVLIQCVSL